jgi:hypothetical protein
MLSIKQDDAVHLTGESDTPHIRCLSAMAGPLSETSPNSGKSRLPPVERVLLRPTRVRMIQGIINKGVRQYSSVLCRKEGRLDASSAEINTEKCLHAVLLYLFCYHPERKTPALIGGEIEASPCLGLGWMGFVAGIPHVLLSATRA